MSALDASLQNILDQTSLKWVFVGGKGGVGKTTTSCSLAIELTKVRKNVLLLSTDPAHNLSDAFSQQFTAQPTLVNGFTNLFAMEIDPEASAEASAGLGGGSGSNMGALSDIVKNMPGIDEALSMAEVFKLVRTMDYDVIVFDTAPTGHTLRLLGMPTMLDGMLGKILSMKSKFGGIMQDMMASMGGGGTEEEYTDKLEETKAVIEEVNVQFKNPDLTTFICVCIPEFLSVYETERLVQELSKFEIDVHNVVVNQIVFQPKGACCAICASRVKMQSKYLETIGDLYEDFHVVKMPQLPQEVRGVDDLRRFSNYLIHPFLNTDADQKMWAPPTQ